MKSFQLSVVAGMFVVMSSGCSQSKPSQPEAEVGNVKPVLLQTQTHAQVKANPALLSTHFDELEPFTTTYNEGGGPQGGSLPAPWGTNVWKPGAKAESGVAEEPSTKMRALYMTNLDGTPSIQIFTTKPQELKPNQNYLASFVYMTEGDATGRFEVRHEGKGADKVEKVGEELDRIGIWKERVIPFTTSASGKVSFFFSTGAVGKKVYIREFKLKEGPKAWKPAPQELGKTGATINEKLIKQIIVVDVNNPRSSDKNSGTAAAPLKTFAAALDKASSTLKAGIPTKIRIAPGVYREGGFQFDGEKIGGKAVDTPLIIEGSAPGKVIMSGADSAGWEAKNWVMVDAAKGIYKHKWEPNWGPSDAMYYKPENTLAQRREMLILNGKRLQQALVENIVYKQGGWAPKVDDEGMRAAGNWSNEGYLGPQVLKSGEFGVAELGPDEKIQNYGYDGHADPNTIFVRLPEGVKSLSGAQIEVGTRDKWMRVWNKNNLVFRNLTVQHFNGYHGSSAFEVEWFWSGRDNHDWIFDNVQMRDNGGQAANISWIRNATFRSCNFSHNGDHGMSLIARNSLFEDTQFSNNGWRYTGQGLWFALENTTFRRCKANENNGFGFRNDHSGHYLTFENCQFNNNKREGGIFFEISQGPITLKNCEIANNAECGMRIISVSNMNMDGCRFLNNAGAQIFFEADKRNTHLMFSMLGTNVPIAYPFIRNWNVTNSTFVTKGKDSTIYGKIWWGGNPQAYVDWFKNEFNGSNNRYWNADNAKPFNIASAWERKDWVYADLKGWQEATGSDKNSVWAAPSS